MVRPVTGAEYSPRKPLFGIFSPKQRTVQPAVQQQPEIGEISTKNVNKVNPFTIGKIDGELTPKYGNSGSTYIHGRGSSEYGLMIPYLA